jgi:hypothetical protein
VDFDVLRRAAVVVGRFVSFGAGSEIHGVGVGGLDGEFRKKSEERKKESEDLGALPQKVDLWHIGHFCSRSFFFSFFFFDWGYDLNF